MTLRTVPVSMTKARQFVGTVHRHNLPPKSGLFAVGAALDTDHDALVAVAIAGRPVARMLDDGQTIEVTRVASDGHRNACSFLYGALTRAAKALGYRRAFTYTLQSEPGSSLKASGWKVDAELAEAPTWDRRNRPRVQTDLFGNERRPTGPKIRWKKEL